MHRVINLGKNEWRLWRTPDPRETPVWTESLPANVPGNVLDDLFRAGIVPDPYYAENFRACAWTADWTFYYRTEFRVDTAAAETADDTPEVRLRFDGLDTFGEVLLNGASIGTMHNMFRRYSFDVTRHVRFSGVNELVVRIDPPIPSAHRWAESIGLNPADHPKAFFGFSERLYTRKAQMSFGWDQTPCLLAGGLYRPVVLEIRTGPVLEDLAWYVSELDVEKGAALLHLTGAADADGAEVRVRGVCGDAAFTGTTTVEDGRWQVTTKVTGARFWWPNGLGEPSLYETQITLEAPGGDVLDRHSLRIGLRTVEVVTGPPQGRRLPVEPENEPKPSVPDTIDGAGTTDADLDSAEETCEVTPFVFKVNGQRVFIKGFDWQAPDALFGRVTDEKTRRLLEIARDCHANMVRIWGGGTVESECFYEVCSEMGLLVWQDFFFACAIYPRDPGFLVEIEGEARDIVRRLRCHTCVACWCGDNESDITEWRRGKRGFFDNPMNKGILPAVLRELDPQARHYHVSSPSGGPHPMSARGGDKRNWGAWDAHSNYRFIRRERARFISEGGCCSYPPVESIERFLPEAVRFPLHNPTWRFHRGALDRQTRCFYPDKRVDDLLAAFGGYADLGEAVEKSQFAQAWGMKLLAEVCRLQKYECGGVLLWKLTECWPCFDLGMIDYYLREKPVLAYIRGAYAPVAVSFMQDYRRNDADIEVFCVNDTRNALHGTVHILAVRANPSGAPEVVAEIATLEAEIGPDESARVHTFPCTEFDPNTTVFLAGLHVESPAPVQKQTPVGAYSCRPAAAYALLRHFRFDLPAAFRGLGTPEA